MQNINGITERICGTYMWKALEEVLTTKAEDMRRLTAVGRQKKETKWWTE